MNTPEASEVKKEKMDGELKKVYIEGKDSLPSETDHNFVPILDEAIDLNKLDRFYVSLLKLESGRITKEMFLAKLNLRQEDIDSPHLNLEGADFSSVAGIRKYLADNRRAEIDKRLKGDRTVLLGIVDFDRVPDKDIEIILKFKNGVLTKKDYFAWVNSVYKEVRQETNLSGAADQRQIYVYETLHPRWKFTVLLDISVLPNLE